MSQNVLIKNIASLTIVQISNYVLPLISVPIISRIIGPEKFGVLNYAIAFIAYFNILITYGFDLTATRLVAADPSNSSVRNKVFSEVFQVQLFLLVISSALFVACIFIFDPLRQEKEVAIFSFLFCIGTLFTQNWLFVAMQDISKVALFDFTSKLLFTLIILVVVKEKKDYIWQPLITSIIQIVVAGVSFYWAVRKYELKIYLISIRRILYLLKSEFVIFFSLILINLYTNTNVVILGLFQSPEKVGFYTGGQKLIIVAYSIVSLPLSRALYPFIGKAFTENRTRGLLIIQKIVPIVILITACLSIGMFIFGPWAIRIFYGVEFEPSILVFQVLAFTPIFITMSSIFGIQIMLNLKMDKVFFNITLFAAIISVAANFWLARKIGYVGTALTWLFTEIFIAVAMYIFLRMKGINPIDPKQFQLKSVRSLVEPVLYRLMHFNTRN